MFTLAENKTLKKSLNTKLVNIWTKFVFFVVKINVTELNVGDDAAGLQGFCLCHICV